MPRFLGHHRRFHVTHLFWKTKITFCIGMLNFTCRPLFFFKVQKGISNLEETLSGGGRRGGSERGEKAGGARRVPEGRGPSPKNKQFHQRLRWGHVLAICFGQGWPRGLRVTFSPEILSGPNHPRPPTANCLQPAASRLGLSCDFRNLIQRGTVYRLPRAATPAGSAPRKQRIQLGARAAGLLRRAEGARVSD